MARRRKSLHHDLTSYRSANHCRFHELKNLSHECIRLQCGYLTSSVPRNTAGTCSPVLQKKVPVRATVGRKLWSHYLSSQPSLFQTSATLTYKHSPLNQLPVHNKK